jgi:hypothetical protein
MVVKAEQCINNYKENTKPLLVELVLFTSACINLSKARLVVIPTLFS